MTERQLLLFPTSRPLADRMGRDFFREVPKGPGVYLLCGGREGVLYVGKAKNLRNRLGSYRSANGERLSRKLRRLLVVVERIYWDECRDETAAIARERELLRTLRPRFNTVGVYPARTHFLGWRRTDRGLAIGIGDSMEEWEQYYGPFPGIKPAYAALLRLTWLGLNPTTPLHHCPSSILSANPPAFWLFQDSSSSGSRTVDLDVMAQRLQSFCCDHSPELPEWLLKFAPAGSLFEEQWRAQDVLCLSEFWEHLALAKDLDEKSALVSS